MSPAAEFTEAMSELASGVVLVTCRLDGRPWGMTVTAFTSVSADPPTVLVSLASRAPGVRAIRESERFGVSILAERQLRLARHGAEPGVPKFIEPFTEPGDRASTSPVVAGALAHLDCEVRDELRIADHTLFVGNVRLARTSRAGSPLLYHRRGYRSTTCLAS